ncbi:MAG: hypothetical protein EP343_14840 [Deltaproteobacteria bacterium]|nr:MAG: hypothetical protein EP343_14840 [Deltaproteobacteria bacterium]
MKRFWLLFVVGIIALAPTKSQAAEPLTFSTCYKLHRYPQHIDTTGALLTSVLHLHTYVRDHLRSTMYFSFQRGKLRSLIREGRKLVLALRKGPKARKAIASRITQYMIRCGHSLEAMNLLRHVQRNLVEYKKLTTGAGRKTRGFALLALCQKKPGCDTLKNPFWGDEYNNNADTKHQCYNCKQCVAGNCYSSMSPLFKFVHRRVLSGVKVDEMLSLVQQSLQSLKRSRLQQVRLTLSPHERRFLVRSFFAHLRYRSLLFHKPTRSNKITLWGHVYGMYKQGWQGLISYGRLNKVFARLLAQRYGLQGSLRTKFLKKFSSYSVTALERISGIQMVLREEQYNPHARFPMYNPRFIRWAVNNIIPSNNLWFGNQSYRFLYNAMFQRLVRLMTESYLILHNKMNLKHEIALYMNAEKKGQTRDHLQQRYQKKRPAYAMKHGHFMVHVAFGFWMRRHLDQTAPPLWNGLQKLLRLFDKRWYQKVRQNYKNKCSRCAKKFAPTTKKERPDSQQSKTRRSL